MEPDKQPTLTKDEVHEIRRTKKYVLTVEIEHTPNIEDWMVIDKLLWAIGDLYKHEPYHPITKVTTKIIMEK